MKSLPGIPSMAAGGTRILFLCFTVLFSVVNIKSAAQAVGISSSSITPDASSILELRSTTKGVLIPRLSTTERDNILSPATGLIIYNTTTNKFNFYTGSGWTIIFSGSTVVNSIAGTTNRISIGGTAADPVIDISSSYTGQASITTLGTISSGTWNGSVIGTSYGGTGITSYTTGDLLYASGASSLGKLTAVASGNALISGGISTAPSWGKIGLTTHVSGVLPIANGGTNSSTTLNNNRIMVSSAGAIGEAAALTNGQLLIGSSSAAPVAANLTAGNGITITNGAGSITIANEPSVFQATATTDVTTTSTTDVLLTGMTITPGAGDYLVWFTGSVENTNSNKQGTLSIYKNGSQVAASVLQMQAAGNIAIPVATSAYITGLGAGQAIEIRWNVLANTGTFHQRTLIAQKVK